MCYTASCIPLTVVPIQPSNFEIRWQPATSQATLTPLGADLQQSILMCGNLTH